MQSIRNSNYNWATSCEPDLYFMFIYFPFTGTSQGRGKSHNVMCNVSVKLQIRHGLPRETGQIPGNSEYTASNH